jgi:CBS domain-containing protein
MVEMVATRIDAFTATLAERLETERFDVLHTHDPIGGNALANLQERGYIDGFVRTVHHLEVFADVQLMRWQARGFRAARQVFCVSRLWQDLLAKEGVLAGSSTGCLLHAALVFCRKQARPMNVVTLVCDSGAKYLSKMFNDFWMMDNGFIKREQTGDLRDLIARRHDKGEDHTLLDTDPIRQAIKRMGMYGVSQMVVKDASGRVTGILDEGDILLGVHTDTEAFERPVSDFMIRRVETVWPDAPVSSLMHIFRADRVAIVVDKKGAFYGLITKIDMINYLRSQLIR